MIVFYEIFFRSYGSCYVYMRKQRRIAIYIHSNEIHNVAALIVY